MASVSVSRLVVCCCALISIHFMGRSGAAAPEPPPAQRLDFRLNTTLSARPIEGDWVYRPLDRGGPYLVTIRATKGGFYDFEAYREGLDRPVLRFDRAGEGTSFSGEVGDGFDSCIPAGARYTLTATTTGALLTPTLPLSAPVSRGRPDACDGTRTYVLSANGRAGEVRLRRADELPGGAGPADAPDATGRAPAVGAAPRSPGTPTASASVTIGAPTAPDGAAVLVLGSLRDASQRLWHHVRLRDVPEEERSETPGAGAEGGSLEESPTAEDEARGVTQKSPGAMGMPGRTGEAMSLGGARPEAAATPAPGPKGPPEGYVPAENVVVRWECRIERAEQGRGPEGPGR